MRQPNESHQEYKERVIDPISASFCAAKWYNATIWLGHGQTTSCHHPPGHVIPLNELKRNHTALHNTTHKKMMRKMMLEGTRPAECEYCWKVEDMGRGNISDRVHKTEIYSDEDVAQIPEEDWRKDVQLKTLEISFDRACNFACSYCNPAFSTAWVRDINVNGPYTNIQSDGRGHYQDTAPWADRAARVEEENPYVIAFWEWWEAGLSETLEEIRVTGGEPIMHKGVWKLFDWFKTHTYSQMRFAINSNLVPSKPALFDRLIEQSQYVNHLSIYTSNETIGAQSEYIRDGMDYQAWRTNLVRLLDETRIENIVIMMTINGLCLESIIPFLDDMMDMRVKYGQRSPVLSLNILRFPSFQSVAILPDSIKQKFRPLLEDWYVRNHDQLHNNERVQVQRLIDYIDVVKTPHVNTAELPKVWNDFKEFFTQYDARRGKNFRETFPSFVDWYDSIELLPPVGEPPVVIDPATMDTYRGE